MAGLARGSDQLDDDTQQHFFGTIILHAQGVAENIPSQNGQAYGRYDIVDGQQRLVTLIILLNELARALAEYDEQQAFSLREQTVFVRDAIGIPRPRVLLNLDADGFFQSTSCKSRSDSSVSRRQRSNASLPPKPSSPSKWPPGAPKRRMRFIPGCRLRSAR